MTSRHAPNFSTKKIRYASSDTPEQIYKQIRVRATDYFKTTGLPKHATVFMAYKAAGLIALIISGYWALTQIETFSGALAAFFLFVTKSRPQLILHPTAVLPILYLAASISTSRTTFFPKSRTSIIPLWRH